MCLKLYPIGPVEQLLIDRGHLISREVRARTYRCEDCANLGLPHCPFRVFEQSRYPPVDVHDRPNRNHSTLSNLAEANQLVPLFATKKQMEKVSQLVGRDIFLVDETYGVDVKPPPPGRQVEQTLARRDVIDTLPVPLTQEQEDERESQIDDMLSNRSEEERGRGVINHAMTYPIAGYSLVAPAKADT